MFHLFHSFTLFFRAKNEPYIASMGIYMIKADVMKRLLDHEFPDANDFGGEVIPGATKMGQHVQAYLFDGYWEDIGTVGAFYEANLQITQHNPPFRYSILQKSFTEVVV